MLSVAVLPFTWMTELGGRKIGMKLGSSYSIGLKENNRKTQVCARHAFDNDPCPPEWKVPEVKALGVSTASKVRKYTNGEQERLDKAEGCFAVGWCVSALD